MSEWKPIDTYDALKNRPLHAVFWFKAVPSKRENGYGLKACSNLSRVMGSRECTHWMPLPEAPK